VDAFLTLETEKEPLMELDWSEQSPHIRTLYLPWQPGDGYDEATIQAAEARLGVRLPATLRNFYLAWGRRKDLTQMDDHLMNPDQLRIETDLLLFCWENQVVCSWGVRREALEEADPPVVTQFSRPSEEEVALGLDWMSTHTHLSSFLDDMTYGHAIAGGAIHKAFSASVAPQPQQIAWLEEHWQKAQVTPMCFGLDPEDDAPPTLYIRKGQALVWTYRCDVAAGSAEALDEIAQALQITWVHRS
jgi:hypothetical protein